jgi:hypothetical protein
LAATPTPILTAPITTGIKGNGIIYLPPF